MSTTTDNKSIASEGHHHNDTSTDDDSIRWEDNYDVEGVFDGVVFSNHYSVNNNNNNNNSLLSTKKKKNNKIKKKSKTVPEPPMVGDDNSITGTEDYYYEDSDSYAGMSPSSQKKKKTKCMKKKNNNKVYYKSRSLIENDNNEKKKQHKNNMSLSTSPIKKYFYDKSTFWLFTLCIVLITILVDDTPTETPVVADIAVNANVPTITNYTTLRPKPLPTIANTVTPPTTTVENIAAPTTLPQEAAVTFVDDTPVVTTVAPESYPITTTTTIKITTTSNPTSARPTLSPTTAAIVVAVNEEGKEQQQQVKPVVVVIDSLAPDSTNNDGVVVPPLAMGPMVGHTTYNSVTLWAYHEWEDYTMEILLYDSDDTVGLIRKIDMVSPIKERNNAIIAVVEDLQANTEYKYGMHINGERVGKGSFRTAPLPFGSSKFDYVLTSCMNHRAFKNQIVWEEISKVLGGRYPDFTMLAGDTVYLQEGVDVTDEDGVIYDRVWFRNQEQRNEPHFANFISNTPIYSTWNDHEYGSNNANYDQKGKENSIRAWEDLWPNPGFGDDNTDDGVYYSYYWGDVHYIVTDDHWYRNPVTNNRLGTKQTEWIRQELINSRGIFKIIVIGSDIMQRDWDSDLTNIGDIVRENSINGVIFHAGDIHRNEYRRVETGGFPYPVTQITSSGIAKVWRRPFVHIKVDTEDTDPSMTAHFYGAASTADITTWSNDPNLKCSDIIGVDRDKEHTCTETIRLSDLQA
ncbi:hypothetical protein FRACYDRAFT_240914 [Fragilariopsis cylindrus CCMP1102]|uniref:PhoD-like phosphatase metallophosphatase domain-containing protein n=1 Tax=Fragilariopsis cylindrus CCMP1102 TaxID=635003 RepID=A0A1E7F961_9STRA|nr:hypothetical protein FRACYDRAFT_240914 [Fragilariopsis cylindrus CCMP1102]|eukprot:OEU14373.1 hypothetical protein FRACYDRAFT_240914 [Fragilariopsis cylindrus CCMP1102]